MNKFNLILLILLFSACQKQVDSILIFAGSASKPALEEVVNNFSKETGVTVNINFGGSGTVLSQMMLSQTGDIYFPGSSDFMEKARQKNMIIDSTEQKVAYLVPSIIVQKGNPKNISSLRDFLRDDVKVVIANPQNVCLGTYAVEIFENYFSEPEMNFLKSKILNYTGSCSKTATAILLKTTDASIGWNVFQYWNNEGIECIPIDSSQVARIGYLPIAVSKYSKHIELAEQFIKYISSAKGKAVFEKYHYFISTKGVNDFIGAQRPIGGVYNLPENWNIVNSN